MHSNNVFLRKESYLIKLPKKTKKMVHKILTNKIRGAKFNFINAFCVILKK
jgi:hypothetical protein